MQTSGTTGQLLNVWGLDGNNVWATGAYGLLVRWNGTAWALQDSGANDNLNAIWGSKAAGRVWLAGEAGMILHKAQ